MIYESWIYDLMYFIYVFYYLFIYFILFYLYINNIRQWGKVYQFPLLRCIRIHFAAVLDVFETNGLG